MVDAAFLAHHQLGRMRAMTGMYHRQFFRDITMITGLVLALFLLGWWGIEQAFLLVPVITLIGAVQTAFDSSYLILARWYASYLERELNGIAGAEVLIGARLEDEYLFPLAATKVVTIPLDRHFSWFSFVTVFYAVLGAMAYGFGLGAGWTVLSELSAASRALYLLPLLTLTAASLTVGLWWFVGGEGERRLAKVLDNEFEGAP
jgi:hypothetical protein